MAATADFLGVEASLGGRRWRWQAAETFGPGYAQRLGIPEIVGRLLAARNIAPEAAGDFLSPTLRAQLPDPFVLRDMERASERLARAVGAGETVAVFGDYDVDGACAAALMAALLGELGCPVLTYIPDRLAEGYGPNAPALAGLIAQGAGLILCVDCGTAAEAVFSDIAGRADIIVLDHHKADGPPPNIFATVNPNRQDDSSGLSGLCATGVAFLAAVALVRHLRGRGRFDGRTEPDLMRALDLVALATVCDVMPLTGLNRAFVAQGLRVMARRERIGLAALLDIAESREAPSAFTCGFVLGPRINAGGRISKADLGLRLLLSTDAREAQGLASLLDQVNRERQGVEQSALDTAMAMAAEQRAAGKAVLMVCAEGWHPGIVGIVAGRIKERFNRPALVGAVEGGVVKGSGRSVPGLDLGAAVIAARQAGILRTGGGHAMAAGFAVAAENWDDFRAFLDDRLSAGAALPDAADLVIDGAISVAGANLALATDIARLAPFGPANEEPVLVLAGARVAYAERIGREGNTLRCTLADIAGERLKAILFRAGATPLAAALLARPPALHLAGHLRINRWQGQESAQFTIIDAAPA
jgi:single-stranded-DNA-specific exonuclease